MIFESATNVITVLFVAFPESTFRSLTPFILIKTSTILLITSKSLPSEMFGTHSTSLFIVIFVIFI